MVSSAPSGRVLRELSPAEHPPHELELRAGLAASQMVGLAVMRYIVEFPAVVDATHDELATMLGPTIQRYLAPLD